MEVVFTRDASEHLQYWRKSGNKKVQAKIKSLLIEIQNSPFEGTGKPEALKHKWTGYWSRRITEEHRLIYKVTNELITVVSLRYHY
ncbi:MAG: Txe/YoeB family addiction module toxin [Mucilaginibacter sp.]